MMLISNRKKLFLGFVVMIPLLLGLSLYAQFSEGEEMIQSSNQTTELTEDSECKYYGYWDYLDDPEEMKPSSNVAMSYNASDAQKVIDDGMKVIINVSHQLRKDESESQWRSDLRGMAKAIRDYSPEDVLWILLWDEPYGQDGLNTEELEQIVVLAREIIGDEFKYGFTLSEGNILNRSIPTNLDVAGINYYPFFKGWRGYKNISTREEFFEYLNELKGIIKETVPDAELSITGQGFYGKQWRKPPLESAKWYVEASQEPDILSMIYWQYRTRPDNWNGLEDIPDLLNAQREAFNEVCSS